MTKKIEKKVYKARNGAPFAQKDAETIGKYIEQFKTPEDILRDTEKNNKSPIKNLLEWDNDKAADSFRVQQVKNIVNHLSVEIVYIGGEVVTFDRAIEYVSGSEKPQIVKIEDAMDNEDMRKEIIARAWANLSGWMTRYRLYKEFDKVFKAVEETRPEIERLISSA